MRYTGRMSGRRLRVALLALCLLRVPALLGGESARAAAPLPAPPAGEAGISVVCDDNYPPYAFRDGSGKLVGIVPDQWAEWSKATGVRVGLSGLPWAEAIRAFD